MTTLPRPTGRAFGPILTLGAALTLGAGPAAAQGLAGDVAATTLSPSVGVGVSTLGFYGEGRVRPTPFVGGRAMIFAGPSFDFADVEINDDTTGDFEIDVKGVALLADIYPGAGAFHVSGGLFLPDSDTNGSFSSESAGDFDASLDFDRDAAPMVTVGLRQRFPMGLTLRAEAGLIVTGFELSSGSGRDEVQREIDDANDDLGDMPGYPYIGVGVAYRF